VVEKMTASAVAAAKGQAVAIVRMGGRLERVWVRSAQAIETWEHCGHGLVYETAIASVDELVAITTRKWQTLTHFGIEADTINTIARRAEGVDRIVPLGMAHQFEPIWDGYDVMQAFCRWVYVAF